MILSGTCIWTLSEDRPPLAPFQFPFISSCSLFSPSCPTVTTPNHQSITYFRSNYYIPPLLMYYFLCIGSQPNSCLMIYTLLQHINLNDLLMIFLGTLIRLEISAVKLGSKVVPKMSISLPENRDIGEESALVDILNYVQIILSWLDIYGGISIQSLILIASNWLIMMYKITTRRD